MNTLSSKALWQQLHDKGLVEGDLPPAGKTESLWYVRFMLGAAGWIGSLFLLGFVAVGFSFVVDSPMAALVVGALACGGAFALFFNARDNDFFTQFALAVGLAGQLLLIYGLFELFEGNEVLFYGTVFVLEAVLTVVIPNFIYRVMTSLAAMVALCLTLSSGGAYGIAPGLSAAGFALIWLQESRWVGFSAICRPAGYGFALSLLLYWASMLWGRALWWPRSYKGASWISVYAPWLGKALVLAVFLAVVFVLLKRMHLAAGSRSGLTALGGATLVLLGSFPVPGIAEALLIMIIGFSICNRVLMGLGLLAFGVFLSNYYYMMQSTLLEKSLLLFGLGAGLLVSRLVLGKWLPPAALGGQADA